MGHVAGQFGQVGDPAEAMIEEQSLEFDPRRQRDHPGELHRHRRRRALLRDQPGEQAVAGEVRHQGVGHRPEASRCRRDRPRRSGGSSPSDPSSARPEPPPSATRIGTAPSGSGPSRSARDATGDGAIHATAPPAPARSPSSRAVRAARDGRLLHRSTPSKRRSSAVGRSIGGLAPFPPDRHRRNSPRSATTTSAPWAARAAAWSVAVDPHHHAEAARPAGLHADQGILDDHGPRRWDAEAAGRLPVGVRGRLPRQVQIVRHPAVDTGVEQVGDDRPLPARPRYSRWPTPPRSGPHGTGAPR